MEKSRNVAPPLYPCRLSGMGTCIRPSSELCIAAPPCVNRSKIGLHACQNKYSTIAPAERQDQVSKWRSKGEVTESDEQRSRESNSR